MAHYLEYDKKSGRIVSEITTCLSADSSAKADRTDSPPNESESFGLLEVDDVGTIDTSLYAVKDGQLVKLYETNEERLERDRLRKEYGEQARARVKDIAAEFNLAQLRGDEATMSNLRKEFKELERYL